MIPTSFPELPKSCKTPGNWQQLMLHTPKGYRIKWGKIFTSLINPFKAPYQVETFIAFTVKPVVAFQWSVEILKKITNPCSLLISRPQEIKGWLTL